MEETVVPATTYEAILLLRRVADFLYRDGIVSEDWLSYLHANATVETLLQDDAVNQSSWNNSERPL